MSIQDTQYFGFFLSAFDIVVWLSLYKLKECMFECTGTSHTVKRQKRHKNKEQKIIIKII